MPKTYHDAILITRHLGIRYLWVDALCIIQDDPEDWRRESAKMRNIYQKSFCTIAAVGAANVNDGILNARPAQEMSLETIGFQDGSPLNTYFGRHIVAPVPGKDRLISDALLNSRGWVFQEMLLSPRILHFTAHSLYLECQGGFASEIALDDQDLIEVKHRDPKDFFFGKEVIEPSIAHEVWLDLVFRYTRKELTEDGDRLPAISGIADRLIPLIKDTYVAGLWRSHMLEGLQWIVSEGQSDKITSTKRPTGYVAPSWSWASVQGPLSNAKDSMGKWETHWDIETWESAIQIIDIQVCLQHKDNPFGQVISGSLRVRARLRQAVLSTKLTTGPAYDGLILTHDEHEQPFRRETPNAIRFDVLEEYAKGSDRENLWCLEVYRCIKSEPIPSYATAPGWFDKVNVSENFFDRTLFHALVLKSTGVENQFQRVGFAKLTTRSYFDGISERLIEIV